MAGIEVEGFEELEDFLNDLKIDPPEERRVVKQALDVIKAAVEPNIPKDTGELQKSQKTSVTQSNGVTTGRYSVSKFYGRFLEFGTSKSKKHVGFFSKNVRKAEEKAIDTVAKELLKDV